ncbi:uncharacterized protein LOC142221032 [Haematobia irritans]|uniref:uncharacterized protein LOC142221032 n=1 Tax=Haematobia irritans TaxID=7368 RepID=UPI003F4FB7EF
MDEGTVIELPNDLSELCRVCLQIPDKHNNLDVTIIYDEDDNLTYAECFLICTDIDLNEGGNVPHCLCKTCGLELQMAYDFYKKVEDSKRSLEQFQQQLVILSYMDTNDSKIKLPQNYKSMHITEETRSQENVNEPQTLTKEETEREDTMTDHISEDYNAGNNVQHTVVLEEHLDMDDYSNQQILDEHEDNETIKIRSPSSNLDLMVLNKSKNYSLENASSNKYARFVVENVEEEQEQEDEEDEEGNEEQYNEDSQLWQDNSIVPHKEYISLESKDDIDDSQFHYEVIEAPKEELDDMDLEKEESKTHVLQSRKRHMGSFSCDVCHKQYPNYSRMMAHRQCHEIDRPRYPCSHCNRMYTTKQAMECHVQTAHDKTGYTCNICKKVFAIRRSLEVHMRFHNGDFPYACNLCDKKFAHIGHLNTHKNVKHNNVRFGCNHPNCGKFFTSSTSLRNHEFTHSTMPFECQYCQRGYPAKAKLRVHIKRKHGIDPSKEEMEEMRKFHVMRSKVNLVKVVPMDEEDGDA